MDDFEKFDSNTLVRETRTYNARQVNPLLTEGRWPELIGAKDPGCVLEQTKIVPRTKEKPDSLYDGIEFFFEDAKALVDNTGVVALRILRTAKPRISG